MFWRSQPQRPHSSQHAQTVEQILVDIGIDAASSRMNTERGYGWSFIWGSAMIEIFISGEENAGFLQILCPLMYLPSGALLPLYRNLLERNMSMTSAALGVYQDIVYVFYERPLAGLDAEETRSIIDTIANYADTFDDELVNEFGGRPYGQI